MELARMTERNLAGRALIRRHALQISDDGSDGYPLRRIRIQPERYVSPFVRYTSQSYDVGLVLDNLQDAMRLSSRAED